MADEGEAEDLVLQGLRVQLMLIVMEECVMEDCNVIVALYYE